MQSLDHRRAAGSLGGVNLRQVRALDQSDLFELFKRLRHLGQYRASGGGHDHVLRQVPAELLGDFEAIGLGPFGVIRPQVNVHKGPAVLIRHLAAQTVNVVIVTTNADRAWAINGRADDLALLQVCGNENETAQPGAGGMGRDCVRQVAGRSAGNGRKAKLNRLGDRHRDHPVFVGERGVVDRVVLDVQLFHSQVGSQAVGLDQGREAAVQADLRLCTHR